jgi:3-phenylpropionate/trans-cinnamate dioxygenase ferredoxin reductase subunit|tara:strand:- start:7769 stop:8998 length:1230 start_codon:yes stop_codon:yes gene_type:complete
MHPGILIIGAGHAGVCAAFSARQAGYTGQITIVANEGLESPYERPKLSKWDARGIAVGPILAAEQFDKAQITRRRGSVVVLDLEQNHAVLNVGDVIDFDRLLLATGASARQFPGANPGRQNLRYLRNLSDAHSLETQCARSRSAAIIGGGLIGLELAATFRKIGLQVTVIESETRSMKRVASAAIANIVEERHTQEGVDFRFGTRVTDIDNEARIRLSNGEVISSDLTVVSVGSVPNTDLAQNAGIIVNNGISVDTHLCTNYPRVFAAGDCCSFPLYGDPENRVRLESWTSAGEQGKIAGWNMVRPVKKKCDIVPYFWSEQFENTIQVVGIVEPSRTTVERSIDANTHITFGLNLDSSLAYACGVGHGSSVSREIRFSSKLIAAETKVTASDLQNPDINLRALFKNART